MDTFELFVMAIEPFDEARDLLAEGKTSEAYTSFQERVSELREALIDPNAPDEERVEAEIVT